MVGGSSPTFLVYSHGFPVPQKNHRARHQDHDLVQPRPDDVAIFAASSMGFRSGSGKAPWMRGFRGVTLEIQQGGGLLMMAREPRETQGTMVQHISTMNFWFHFGSRAFLICCPFSTRTSTHARKHRITIMERTEPVPIMETFMVARMSTSARILFRHSQKSVADL